MWNDLQRHLESLPDFSPTWDEAESALRQCLEFIDKRNGRIANMTAAAVDGLVREHTETLRFLGEENLPRELSAVIPVIHFADQVTALHEALTAYTTARSRPAENLQSEKQLRHELDNQERLIAKIVQQLRDHVAIDPRNCAAVDAPSTGDPGGSCEHDVDDAACVTASDVPTISSVVLHPTVSGHETPESFEAADDINLTSDTIGSVGHGQPDQLLSGASASKERRGAIRSPAFEKAEPVSRSRDERAQERRKRHKRLKRLKRKSDGKPHGTAGRDDVFRDDRMQLQELITDIFPDEDASGSELAHDHPRASSTTAVDKLVIDAFVMDSDGETLATSGVGANRVEVTEANTAIHSPEIDANCEAEISEYLPQALRERDFAGAYWWLLSRETSGHSVPIPSWLPAAIQASRANVADDMAIADELAQLGIAHYAPDDPAAQLLAAAAALLPTLTQPLLDAKHWLAANFPLPAVRDIVNAVRSFAEHGQTIDATGIGQRLSRDDADGRVKDAAGEAGEWWKNAGTKTASFQRATRVWKQIVTADDQLAPIIRPVIDDRRQQLEVVIEQCNNWRQRSFIVRRVHELDAHLSKGRHDAIEGSALDQIVAWSYEACEFADQWIRAVRQWRRTVEPATWLDQQIQQLREMVGDRLTDAQAELAAIDARDDMLFSAAGSIMTESLNELATFIGCDTAYVTTRQENPCRGLGDVRGLRRCLANRLLLLPQVALDDQGEPNTVSLPRLWSQLEQEESSLGTIPSALREWVRKRDFRFTNHLLDLAESSDDWPALSRDHDEALRLAQQSLEARRHHLEVQLQYGLIDGVISESARAEVQQRLLELSLESVRNFVEADAVCDELERTIRDAYEQHVAEQRLEWEENQERWLEHVADDDRREIRTTVEAALQRQDTRVVHEYFSNLQAAQARGVKPTLRPDAAGPLLLEDFLSRHDRVLEVSREQPARRNGGYERLIEMAGAANDLPPQRLAAACHALEGWHQLRRKPLAKRDPRAEKEIPQIIEFLGLEPIDKSAETIANGRTWTHLQIQAAEGGLSLVPQFGSLRHGQYDVLCVWEGPSPDAILAIINEARLLRPTLVLFFDRLSLSQRGNLAAALKRAKHRTSQHAAPALLIIDDVMMVFLATQAGVRWPVLQQAGLPFTSVNPYHPASAGNLPREMFFGRKQMISSLLDFGGNGSCVVYGGRQLGKSALLRRAQDQFHDPAQKQFAIYREIRNLGDPLADMPTDYIWTALRDELNQTVFNKQKPITAEKPDAIIKHVRQQVEADARLRLLILLDEADTFLAQDAMQNFRHVTELKNLMERTDRRVKVVFAGLHNVERFQSIPNHPFAHLGVPLQVGPLEPIAAMDLVKMPMEVVGYRFADESLVLKILSYTNHHPGLIQLFCFRLLDDLHKRPTVGGPPMMIEDAAVRAVYAKAETQKDIRERFDLTLGLDARYRAIAGTIIEDQLERIATSAAVHAPRELAERVAVFWPRAFAPMPLDYFRSLLDEMCGLGILLKVAEGYRLRCPNLIHLFGDREEIRTKLFELDSKPAPDKIDFNRHRVLLDKSRRSPFPYWQATQLVKPQFGVGLLFGSIALGWEEVHPAVERLVAGRHAAISHVASMNVSTDDVEALETRLRQFLETHRQGERLALLVEIDGAADFEAVIRASVDFCRKRERSERQWLRILLTFPPVAAWHWFGLPDVTRNELESLVSAAVRLNRWDREAVALHLSSLTPDRLTIDAVEERLMSATGGWPLLVDEVFRRCAEAPDPRPAADEVVNELSEDGSLTNRFRESLGLHAIPNSDKAIKALRQLGTDTFDTELFSLVTLESEVAAPPDRLLQFLLQLQVIDLAGANYCVNPRVAQVIALP